MTDCEFEHLFERAEKNFKNHLEENSYPGRGIVIGQMDSGEWLQLYWIMGRSTNSRNRKFVIAEGRLRTEVVDPSLVEDTTNIIYDAMTELPSRFIVSNGNHTLDIVKELSLGGSFDNAIERLVPENDSPHLTPRIAGLLDMRSQDKPRASLAIVKANKVVPGNIDRDVWHLPSLSPGLGYGITTYKKDGDPLLSFDGSPMLLPIKGGFNQVMDLYWGALNKENRVAIAGKHISEDSSSSVLATIGYH